MIIAITIRLATSVRSRGSHLDQVKTWVTTSAAAKSATVRTVLSRQMRLTAASEWSDRSLPRIITHLRLLKVAAPLPSLAA
jgi:hypothetical protein